VWEGEVSTGRIPREGRVGQRPCRTLRRKQSRNSYPVCAIGAGILGEPDSGRNQGPQKERRGVQGNQKKEIIGVGAFVMMNIEREKKRSRKIILGR